MPVKKKPVRSSKKSKKRRGCIGSVVALAAVVILVIGGLMFAERFAAQKVNEGIEAAVTSTTGVVTENLQVSSAQGPILPQLIQGSLDHMVLDASRVALRQQESSIAAHNVHADLYEVTVRPDEQGMYHIKTIDASLDVKLDSLAQFINDQKLAGGQSNKPLTIGVQDGKLTTRFTYMRVPIDLTYHLELGEVSNPEGKTRGVIQVVLDDASVVILGKKLSLDTLVPASDRSFALPLSYGGVDFDIKNIELKEDAVHLTGSAQDVKIKF